ncbi:MAG: hypothetical protein LC777_14100 [Actinobacteria bacterium]|nr:hypothetical protein [Actinomycetota bacterium]
MEPPSESEPQEREQRRQAEIAASLATPGFCLPGTLTERRTRCSSAGCHCRGEPAVLHGPYYSWTRKIGGKTVTQTLSAEQAQRYGPWFENARRLRALAAELEALSLAIAERAEGWGQR